MHALRQSDGWTARPDTMDLSCVVGDRIGRNLTISDTRRSDDMCTDGFDVAWWMPPALSPSLLGPEDKSTAATPTGPPPADVRVSTLADSRAAAKRCRRKDTPGAFDDVTEADCSRARWIDKIEEQLVAEAKVVESAQPATEVSQPERHQMMHQAYPIGELGF